MFTYLFPNPLRKHWDIIDPFLTSSDNNHHSSNNKPPSIIEIATISSNNGSYNGGFQETPKLFLTIKP
jgi:hypothetical protein